MFSEILVYLELKYVVGQISKYSFKPLVAAMSEIVLY